MKGLGVVGEKSYAFAIRIVNAYKILCRNKICPFETIIA